MLPAFCSGLWEDFTKSVSPRRRMFAIALSALLGVVFLHGSLNRTGWGPLDTLATVTGLGSLGAIFAVTGISNSINIIDGLNGLASMCVTLMMAGMAYIAFQVGDVFVGSLALATLSASLGFFMWNYPRGLVFLGDGGAYLLGFIAAELGVLLTQRNPAVSLLTPLLLVAYPVFETLFTMYRRRVIRGRPMTMPDGIHLHTLLYRRLMRWAVGSQDAAALTRGNSRTSPYLWVLSSLALVPAVMWWDNTPALALSLLGFVVLYLWLYWRIVTFRTPFWMSVRSGRHRRRQTHPS
jgi:UDP-N-acetylmuramyl pentapeptide phosphotransferase/UDP-N-acetylglucosamine-1-phosphate transferase